MKITILGWSGRTGQEVVKQALARWMQVTVLVRNPEKLGDLKNKVTIVQWSASNPDDVTRAIQDADLVVHTVSVPFFHKKPTKLFSQVANAVIQARPSTKAKQYIVMSSFGTHQWRKLPWPANWWYEFFLWDVADDKELEESLLQTSALPWTIIKAVLLNDNEESDYHLTAFEQFKPSIFSHVSRKTVAKAILDISQDAQYRGKKIVVS